MDNKTLTIMLKRINTSIAVCHGYIVYSFNSSTYDTLLHQAVESYLPYLQQHHINASSFPLENYIKAIIGRFSPSKCSMPSW